MKKLWKATHNKRDQAEAGKGYSDGRQHITKEIKRRLVRDTDPWKATHNKRDQAEAGKGYR